MKRLLLILSVFYVSKCLNCLKSNSIWPYPQSLSMRDNFFLLNPHNFSILTDSTCSLLTSAIARYKSRLFIQNCAKINPAFTKPFFSSKLNLTGDHNELFNGFLQNLTVNFKGSCEKWPSLEMNEKYRLIVSGNEAKIKGDSVWGALRGLETFAQMLVMVGLEQFTVNEMVIEDYPRFAHRGLLIDTSRHFLPLHIIYETLDTMEMNKLNVLHWHIVDDQSFPFVSDTFPELSQKGAFEPNTYVYSKSDVYSIIEYARQRGIRVIPEFDTPGHTQSMRLGQPGLLTECYNESTGQPNGHFGPIDPTKNSTFKFLQTLYTEISERFQDQYLHLGGDEVKFTIKCWATNPKTRKFMEDMGWGNDTLKLEGYYMQKLIDLVQGLNRSYIVWQDVFDNNATLAQETIVQVWRPWGHKHTESVWQYELGNITSRGHRALLSARWYLDILHWGEDWRNFYQIEPLNFTGTAEQKKLVLGGEACMWGEYVNGANFISRVWPRTSAVAERLWSSEKLNNTDDARERFKEMTCRMQKMGFRVEPIDGPGWCPCDYAL